MFTARRVAAIRGKKGLSMAEYWIDALFYALLVAGFVVSVALQSAFLSYVVVVLFGLAAGRFVFQFKKYVTTYIILTGFLIGYVLGSRFADWTLLTLFFLFGAAFGYYIYEKGLLEH